MPFPRSEIIWLGPNEMFGHLAHLSKNLWNQANYVIRQEMFTTGRMIGFRELRGSLKNSPNYKSLPAQTAQYTLLMVEAAWYAYHKAHDDWKLHPEKYLAEPRFPKYKAKDGQYIVGFTNQQSKLKDGVFTVLPKLLGLNVRTRLPNGTKISGARVIPKGVGYQFEITYEKEVKIKKKKVKIELDEKDGTYKGPLNPRILGLDAGAENLLATANNIGTPPILFKGGPVKSVNQYYNKKKAKLQSQYAVQHIGTGPAMQRLSLKRDRRINDYFHRVTKLVVLYCKMWEIDVLVIGRNKNWKQGINLGARNNQMFVYIPFYRLWKMLKYKAEEAGITVIEVEEDYTSICSLLDRESIEHHEVYMGKRIKRGLFRTAKGGLINADVNGAGNTIRKVFPNAMDKVIADGIEGVSISPIRAVVY